MNSYTRRYLSKFYQFLLFNSQGRQRSMATTVVFKGDLPRYPISRLFYKKNGRLRQTLNEKVRTFFEGAELTRWIKDNDTPSQAFLDRISARLESRPPVLLVFAIGPDIEETLERAKYASTSIGVLLSVLVLRDEDSAVDANGKVSSLFASKGIPVIPFASLRLQDFLYVIWVGTGARLRQHGIWMFVDRLVSAPASISAYSDTAEIGPNGLVAHWFKPNFSKLLTRHVTLFGEVFAVTTETAQLFFWIDGEPHFDQRTRRAFELSAAKESVEHIQNVLYYMTGSTDRNMITAEEPKIAASNQVTTFSTPSVSIIIPTRNRWDLLEPCLRSVLQSDWDSSKLEVIVIDNGSDEAETLTGLERLQGFGQIKVIQDDRPFNYSQLNNRGAAESNGSLLVFLNNDTVVTDFHWLTKLSELAMQPGSGAVGAKLLYPDSTVQHVGVVLGIHGGAGHPFVGLPNDSSGYHGLATSSREVSAVTGACLAVRKEAFRLVGGFDENLRVAYNDIALCSRFIEVGLQNYVVADPLIIHHESKSRGLNLTRSKQIADLQEAIYARHRFNSIWRNDPFYSPNLSLTEPYTLARFPRRKSPWSIHPEDRKHVLILSSIHQRGFGVPVVIDRHVSAFLLSGFRVTVGGPERDGDYPYAGAERKVFHGPEEAAAWALSNGIDLIWAHTPPFFSVSRWVAGQIPLLAYDHGEPPASLFPDSTVREDVILEKAFSLAMADQILAISSAVSDESLVPVDSVIPLGTDHLSKWSPEFEIRRPRIRENLGWTESKVVLNVCRFTTGERNYKGLDTYIEVMQKFMLDTSLSVGKVRFVICGRGRKSDEVVLRESGLEVFANLSDQELVEMYAGADIYANFSRWEGYNLGIGQALAMGLEIVASDIPAHRAFGVATCRDASEAVLALSEKLQSPKERKPRLWQWARSENEVVEASIKAMGISQGGPRQEVGRRRPL